MGVARVADVVEGPVGRGVTVGYGAGGHVGAEIDEAVGAEVAERIVAGSIRIEDSAGAEVRRPVAEQVRRKGVRREIATGTVVRAVPVELVDPETGVVVEVRDRKSVVWGQRV